MVKIIFYFWIHMARNFTESLAAMTKAGSVIKPFSLLMFAHFFLNLVFLVFNQLAIAQTETREERITVGLKDFVVHLNITQAKTGRLTLEAVNEGMSIHELVIFKTDLNPAALPRKESKPPAGDCQRVPCE